MIQVVVVGPGWKVLIHVDKNIGGSPAKVAARLRTLGLAAKRQGEWVVIDANVVPDWLAQKFANA